MLQNLICSVSEVPRRLHSQRAEKKREIERICVKTVVPNKTSNFIDVTAYAIQVAIY